jgi:hypothetical protein
MPTRYASGKAFDPEVADLMRDAFKAAWQALQQSGSVDAMPYRADATRERLALRIIEATQAGERDVDRLRDDALASLSHAGMKKQP